MQNEIPYPVEIEISKGWGGGYQWGIECGVWWFDRLIDLIEYYEITDLEIIEWDEWNEDEHINYGKVYKGKVNKNLEDHNWKFLNPPKP